MKKLERTFSNIKSAIIIVLFIVLTALVGIIQILDVIHAVNPVFSRRLLTSLNILWLFDMSPVIGLLLMAMLVVFMIISFIRKKRKEGQKR